MRLNELADIQGARKSARRVGRGIGSGKGKTAGRGHKGQNSRSGVAIKGFEGGQMPLYRRLPKRGFHNIHAKNYQELTVAKLQSAIDAGRIDASKAMTEADLVTAGVVRRRLDGVRLTGAHELKAKIQIEVTGASKGAIAAVEKADGSVTVTGKPKRKRNRGAKAAKAAKKGQALTKKAAGDNDADAGDAKAEKPAAETPAEDSKGGDEA